jgi:hypothetical protein
LIINGRAKIAIENNTNLGKVFVGLPIYILGAAAGAGEGNGNGRDLEGRLV